MPSERPQREFVTWGDVHEMVRWLEAGYGCRFKFAMVVACPKGEQWPRQYWELYWCDNALQERALPQRLLVRFPDAGAKSLAAALLGLLWRADNVLAEVAVWTEPKMAVRPRGEPAAKH